MSKKIEYKGGYKYILHKSTFFLTGIFPDKPLAVGSPTILALNRTGVLSLRAGYAWDGASGYPDKPTIMRASLVHDALYQLIRERKLPMSRRIDADKLLRKMCREDGMPAWEAWCVYKAVRNFGKFCVKKPKEVKVAPWARGLY